MGTLSAEVIAGVLGRSPRKAVESEKDKPFDSMAALEEAEEEYLAAFEKKDRKGMARARLAAHRIAAAMED